MTWVDISVCFSVFRVYVLGLSFTSPGYGLGAYLIHGYVPGYRSSSSLLIIKQVCLSLKSSGLFSHSDQVLCVLFCLILFLYLFLPLSLISLLNKNKNKLRPKIQENMVLHPENCEVEHLDMPGARAMASRREFVITLTRCGLYFEDPPTWQGVYLLISTCSVPLQRVGFLPVIPKPITQRATV